MSEGRLRLVEIHVYPLKGAQGIALESAEVLRGGLRHDRRFMVLGPDDVFITQRSHPRLALVTTALSHPGHAESSLTLRAPNGGSATVELGGDTSRLPRRIARCWNDDVDAVVVEGDAPKLLSDHLGLRCTLVFMPDDAVRVVDAAYGKPGDRVGFADGYPVLLASRASLDELNGRLAQPVPMNRFRPNLVVEGGTPFEEDRHPHVRIGGTTFRMPKRCARCTVTTVDQSTGIAGKEPLRTLATYRTENKKVYFAQNLIPDLAPGVADTSVIAIDDEIAYGGPLAT